MLLAIALVQAAQAGHPPGTTLDAMAIDLTPAGFDLAEELATAFVPPSIEVGGFHDESGGLCLFGYVIDVYDMTAYATVDSLMIVPADDGRIYLDADVTISLDSESDPFTLFTELLCIDDTCDAWIEPFPVSVTTSMALTAADDGLGGTIITADVAPLDLSYELDGGDIGLSGCLLDDLSFLIDIFIPLLDDALLGALDGVEQDVEDAINEALAGDLSFSDTLEVADGVALDIALGLGSTATTAEGLRLVATGSVASTTAHACVAAYDLGESLATPSAPPTIGAVPVGIDPGYPVGVAISDDFVNQALYGIWQAGLLCQNIDEDLLGDSLPLALDTTLVDLLMGGVLAPLFPEPQPVRLATRPMAPPVLELGEAVNVAVDDLALEVWSHLDDREVLITDVALDVNAGLGLTFDPTNGNVGVTIALDEGVAAEVLQNEYLVGEDATIEGALAGLLSNPLISGLVGDALAGLSFSLPTIGLGDVTLGLTDVQMAPAGPDLDFLGAYVWAGPVDYVSTGGCGGCGDTSSTGCSSGSSGCTLGATSCLGSSSGAACGSATYASGSTCDCGTTTGSTTGCGCALGSVDGRAPGLVFAVLMVARRRRS